MSGTATQTATRTTTHTVEPMETVFPTPLGALTQVHPRTQLHARSREDIAPAPETTSLTTTLIPPTQTQCLPGKRVGTHTL